MRQKEKSISYAGIKQMNKTTYYRRFKNPTIWKKSKAMICVMKHKFTNGKVPLVCIPYLKKNEAVKVFKDEVKKELSSKFILLADIRTIKHTDGKPAIEITPIKGEANIRIEAKALFGLMKFTPIIKGSPINSSESVIDKGSSPQKQTVDSAQTDPNNQTKKTHNFKQIIRQLNPDFKKLNQITTNLKAKKITVKDIEVSNKIRAKIFDAITHYKALSEPTRKEFATTYTKLQAMEIKVEKINDMAMFIDSAEKVVLDQQCAILEKEMQKILAKYGIKLEL